LVILATISLIKAYVIFLPVKFILYIKDLNSNTLPVKFITYIKDLNSNFHKIFLFLNFSKQNIRQVRFQVFKATSKKMAVFWDVAPFSLVDIDFHLETLDI
jgi:hypothetical protein